MTSRYDGAATRALATIEAKGAAVSFAPGGSAAGSMYDPLTNQWSGGSSDSWPGSAVQIPGDPDRFAALKLMLTDPITLLVAAKNLTAAPTPGMSMVWDGVLYTVKDVEPVAPAGSASAIVYTVTGSR